MKINYFILFGIISLISCVKNDDYHAMDQLGEVCEYKADLIAPEGYEIRTIGEVDYNNIVRDFQFIDDQTGYAMLSSNIGGYVEVFKTTNGGQSWNNLDVGIKQHPRSMIFKNENYGIITVLDVTGCPPPNCQNNCVILKTKNGGLDWEEVEFEELKGMFNHLQYDSEGKLYANLYLDGQSSLMKSNDNGKNWDTLIYSSELGDTLNSYNFEIFRDNLFISDGDGRIIVVNSNGDKIKTIETDNSQIQEFELIDENNIILVDSDRIIKSTNGGDSWETIYGESAKLIGFETIDKGHILLGKSVCPTDVYQSNDLIASTNNGGLKWVEAEETTTNLLLTYVNSQWMGNSSWYIVVGSKLVELSKK